MDEFASGFAVSTKYLCLYSAHIHTETQQSVTPETLAIIQNGRQTFRVQEHMFHFNLMTLGHDNKHF